MSGQLLLLSLSQFILVPIYSEWIVDVDLCSLDTAVCNHSVRDKFLQDVSKCSGGDMIHLRYRESYYEAIMEWYMMRKIKLFVCHSAQRL